MDESSRPFLLLPFRASKHLLVNHAKHIGFGKLHMNPPTGSRSAFLDH